MLHPAHYKFYINTRPYNRICFNMVLYTTSLEHADMKLPQLKYKDLWLVFAAMSLLLSLPVSAQSEEQSDAAEEAIEAEQVSTNIGLLALASTASPGANMLVDWTGPGNAGDAIHLSHLGSDKILAKVATEADDFRPAIVKAPLQAGDYELRLISDKQVLASASFSVVTAKAQIKILSPIVLSGESVSVEWTGPRNSGDSLVVAAPGNSTVVSKRPASGSVKNQLELAAPVVPGKYEVRLVSKQNVVLADQDFEVR